MIDDIFYYFLSGVRSNNIGKNMQLSSIFSHIFPDVREELLREELSREELFGKNYPGKNCMGKNCSWEELLLERIVGEELIREELRVNHIYH
jgi:hypothetical protein